MANEKESTKLYKVRNGYAVMKGNQVIKEGNVALTDKEHALQSWKVEKIEEKEGITAPCQFSDALADNLSPHEGETQQANIDRSVKKSRFNRAMKTPKG